MAMYRVLKRLSSGKKPGDVVPDTAWRDGVIPALVKVNAIKRIDGPPLTELPGWTRRAELLAEAGITIVDQFLEADGELIRKAVGYHSTRMVTGWKEDVRRWLMPAPVKRR